MIQIISKLFFRDKPILLARNTAFHQTSYLKQITTNEINKSDIPIRPEKPLTPYVQYIMKIKPLVKKLNPNATSKDITTIIADQWKKVDTSTRAELENEYKVKLAEYKINLKNFENSLSIEEQIILHEKREEKLQLKQKMKDLGKPRKPPSAYFLFSRVKRQDDRSLPYNEWQMKISNEWKTLPEQEKQIYREMYKQKWADYKEELKLWEQEMVNQGHFDVLLNKNNYDTKVFQSFLKKDADGKVCDNELQEQNTYNTEDLSLNLDLENEIIESENFNIAQCRDQATLLNSLENDATNKVSSIPPLEQHSYNTWKYQLKV